MTIDEPIKKGAGKRAIITLTQEPKKQEVDPKRYEKRNDLTVVEVIAMHEALVAQHGGTQNAYRGEVFDPKPYQPPPEFQANEGYLFAYGQANIYTLTPTGGVATLYIGPRVTNSGLIDAYGPIIDFVPWMLCLHCGAPVPRAVEDNYWTKGELAVSETT
jgi:hypothetical protein